MNLEFEFTLESSPEPYTAINFCIGREDGYYVSATYHAINDLFGRPLSDEFEITDIHVNKELPESKRKYHAKRNSVIVSTATATLRLKTFCTNSLGRRNYFSQKIGESVRLTITGLYSIDDYNLRCTEYALSSPRFSTMYTKLEFEKTYNLIEKLTCISGGGGMSAAAGGGGGGGMSAAASSGGGGSAISRPVGGGGMSAAAGGGGSAVTTYGGGGMSAAALASSAPEDLSENGRKNIISALSEQFPTFNVNAAPDKTDTIQLVSSETIIYLTFKDGDITITQPFLSVKASKTPLDTMKELESLKERLITIVKTAKSSRRNRRRKNRKNRNTRRRR